MTLYLMRHGIAEHQAANGKGDRHRALTPQGREGVERIARFLRAAIPAVGTVYASPLVRAQETAAIVAASLTPGSPVVTMDEIATAPTSATLFDAVLPLLDGGDALIVGHEPTISMLASLLVFGRDHGRIHFTQSTVAAIEISRSEGRLLGALVMLVSPANLEHL